MVRGVAVPGGTGAVELPVELSRGSSIPGVAQRPVLATGFPALDELLSGGWPAGALIELLLDRPGTGELGLLIPLLARLGAPVRSDQPAGWVMLIDPPWIPYGPGLVQRGLVLARLLVVRSAGEGIPVQGRHSRAEQGGLWAMEEALRSGSCAGLVAWVPSTRPLVLRRLQLAAGDHAVWVFLIRPMACRRERSPAALRVAFAPVASSAHGQVDVFRNRFGRTGRVILGPGG